MFISIDNIEKSYGEGENRFQVLKGISFQVEKGEMVVLLGPSGSVFKIEHVDENQVFNSKEEALALLNV